MNNNVLRFLLGTNWGTLGWIASKPGSIENYGKDYKNRYSSSAACSNCRNKQPIPALN